MPENAKSNFQNIVFTTMIFFFQAFEIRIINDSNNKKKTLFYFNEIIKKKTVFSTSKHTFLAFNDLHFLYDYGNTIFNSFWIIRHNIVLQYLLKIHTELQFKIRYTYSGSLFHYRNEGHLLLHCGQPKFGILSRRIH